MAEAKRQKTEEGPPERVALGISPGISDEALMEALDKIEGVQDELDKLNEQASDEILKVEQKYNKERKPVFVKRNQAVSTIPDFWPSVWINHPELCSTLTEEDKEVFTYLREVFVEDFPDIRSGHTISLTFAENPYFEDAVLKKTYKFSDSGTVAITGTKIRWKPGKDITRASENGDVGKEGKKRELEEQESFFKWFDAPEGDLDADAVEDEVADLIREEVWPNPLKLYTQDGLEEEEEDEDEEGEDEEGEEGEEGGEGEGDDEEDEEGGEGEEEDLEGGEG